MTATPSSTPAHTQGALFIVSGPSGVGKDTILSLAMPRLANIRTSISATTREPRDDETPGVSYFFLSLDEFRAMIDADAFLEFAPVHKGYYGTPKAWVLEQLAAGTDVILEIDVQGAAQVKARYPEAIRIFLAPPSMAELERRLRDRGTEQEDDIQQRLHNAPPEIRHLPEYDYVVINDTIENAVERFVTIVQAERLRPWRQPIADLMAEVNHG
jgi:guanylate kinase